MSRKALDKLEQLFEEDPTLWQTDVYYVLKMLREAEGGCVCSRCLAPYMEPTEVEDLDYFANEKDPTEAGS